MTFILALIGGRKWIAYLAVILAIVAGIYGYGRSQYKAGVMDTTQHFIDADKKGAEDVAETAKRVLRDNANLDDDAIADSLHRTGGLRPDESPDFD
ncbi:MAG: hypothetical protein WBC93_06260 [Sulfitobacter sp.]